MASLLHEAYRRRLEPMPFSDRRPGNPERITSFSNGSTDTPPFLGENPRDVDFRTESASTVEGCPVPSHPFPMTRDAPTFLFAYGTLAPDVPEAAARGGWTADRVRG